jgi:DNA-binding NarL/FixJ family response regulator
MMETIRILIADDHAFYREGVRTMLSALPGAEVVGEAASGDEAVAQAAALQPDMILMDIKMPGLTGIEATRAISQANPQIAILVVTMFDDDESVFAAMQAGARGYLLKDAKLADLLRAVTAVSEGDAIFSPAIARRMVHFFSAPRLITPSVPFPDLTEREREVLTLVAQGWSNEAIATRLVLSLKTVRNHVSTILSKLQVSDRAGAIVKARDAGMR